MDWLCFGDAVCLAQASAPDLEASTPQLHSSPPGRIEISAQNHNFAVDPDTLPKEVEVSHINLNDGTCAGMLYPAKKAMTIQVTLPPLCLGQEGGKGGGGSSRELDESGAERLQRFLDSPTSSARFRQGNPTPSAPLLQYHPEASPGPHDADICFAQFIEMLKAERQPVAA